MKKLSLFILTAAIMFSCFSPAASAADGETDFIYEAKPGFIYFKGDDGEVSKIDGLKYWDNENSVQIPQNTSETETTYDDFTGIYDGAVEGHSNPIYLGTCMDTASDIYRGIFYQFENPVSRNDTLYIEGEVYFENASGFSIGLVDANLSDNPANFHNGTGNKYNYVFTTNTATGKVGITKTNSFRIGSSQVKLFSPAITLPANKWQSFKLKIDFAQEIPQITATVGAITATESLSFVDDMDIGAVTFFNVRAATSGLYKKYLDNIKIYRAKPCVESVKISDLSGASQTDAKNVSPRTNKIFVSFANPMNDDVADNVSLSNSQITSVLSDDKKTLEITLDGFLQSQSSYTLSVNGAQDVYGDYLQDFSLDFATGFDPGTIEIAETAIKDTDGNNITDISKISAGGEYRISVTYVQTKLDGAASEYVLAYTAEKNNKIVDFTMCDINADSLGLVNEYKQFVVKDGIEFDTVSVFLWDKATRIPVCDSVILK